MIGATKGNHFVNPRSVLRRLEGIRLEILVIILEIKRVGVELPALLLKLAAAYRCDKTAVYTAREKCTDGNVREHLKLYGICHQIAGLFYGLIPVILMWITFKAPVTGCGKARAVVCKIMSRQQLIYVLENTLTVGLCRAKTKDLAEPFPVKLRLELRKAQDSLEL